VFAACLSSAPAIVSSQLRERACPIGRDSRVFVALADDATLDEYESAASEAQAIMHRVESSLCARVGRRTRARDTSTPASLRRALEIGTPIKLDEVRFDDRALAHARVRLRANAAGSTELVIRVYLHRDEAWQVDAVRDESGP
jgi:hypothetical protein